MTRIIGKELEDILCEIEEVERIMFSVGEKGIYCEIEVNTPLKREKFEELIKRLKKDGWNIIRLDISTGIPHLLIEFLKEYEDKEG